MIHVIYIVCTGIVLLAAPPFGLVCGLSGCLINGVPGLLSLQCSATNAQGPVAYACDVDGVAVPCERRAVM